MKKKILFFSVLLLFILVTLLQTKTFAVTNTLGKIAEIFNNSSSVNDYGELLGYEFIASIDEDEPNVLLVTITKDEGSSTVSFEQEGNILSNTQIAEENAIVAFLLADSIGQANGYNDGELLENFNMFIDEVYNYTVEDEGFEIIENDSYYSAKMDITKKVPLIDSSKYYLKPETFDIIKDIIEDGSTGNQNGRTSKFAYNLEVNEEENYIYIGEEDEITDSTYKSILSALEVMYGDKVVEYFKSIYPELQDGYTVLDGFTIDIDTDIDLEEHPIYTGTKVVLVTIDNQFVKNEVLRSEYIGETVKRGDKTITLDFTKNESFKLGFFDEVSSSDAAFLFKYILEPVFIESEPEAELIDNTVYFNIVNGKIVVGDKNNSVFKLVISEDYLELLPTKTDIEKTIKTAKHEEVKAIEYEPDKSQDHFRYGEYDVSIDVIYGRKEKTTTYEVLKGAGQKINISNSEELTFKFDIEYEKFIKDGKVYIDGKLVDKSNYTSRKGSTEVTFNSDYVKNLSAGEHILKVAVADGEVSTTFSVEKSTETTTANDSKTEITSTENSKTKTTSANNPVTGDNITLWISLALVSIMGVVVTILFSKKRVSKH